MKHCVCGWGAVLLGLSVQHAPALAAVGPPLVAWEFSHPGDFEQWQPNAHLADASVMNGVLSGRTVGPDPILEYCGRLDLVASPWQMLEVRLKADADGAAEFFWSNTETGRYGGFSQEKSTRFDVIGDAQWRWYRLMPCWHPEGQIVRLRFDLFDGATFAIDAIRIVALEMPPAVERPEFDFVGTTDGWQGIGGQTVAAANEIRLVLQTADPGGFALAPPVRFDAGERTWLSLQLAALEESRGILFFATEAHHGWHRFEFPIAAGPVERTRNLDLLAVPDWRGRVIALGLRLSSPGGAALGLRRFAVADAPQGPPQMEVVAFGVDEALPRAGRATMLHALITNTGGEPATNLQGRLQVPAGLQLASTAPVPPAGTVLEPGEELRLAWRIKPQQAVTGQVQLVVTADRAVAAEAATRAVVLPALNLPPADYVPVPQPVRGPVEVGVYYFPGWKAAGQWEPILRFPERKPVLGWYREGDPEVADWHIKWAVEHGITFFVYDWYWSQGARQLEHALHDGYFQARYRHLLKFCLLWANHNAPRTSSHEDCLAVTRYWIEHYFRQPEHLTVEGRPMVIIFSPHRLTADLGSAGVKAALAAMRAECRRAGLAGLHLVACVADVGSARHAAAEGYDAVTAYTWPGLGRTNDALHAPFATLLDGYRRNWERIREECPIPLQPLPVCGGWDSRPWHGDQQLVRFGRTPRLFQQHLAEARQFLEPAPAEGAATPAMVLVEAWNEWGEGAYIEPHQEFGFDYLDAIRQVFTAATPDHQDVTPADVGRGPFDLEPTPPARTAWTFDNGAEGWAALMQLTDERAGEGMLSARTAGDDPAWASPPLQSRAREFDRVHLRLRLTRLEDGEAFEDRAQLFWRTARFPESEAASERFQILGDGQWHDYVVTVAGNRRWTGRITRLRFDPCNQPGVRVEIDEIRLDRSAGFPTGVMGE